VRKLEIIKAYKNKTVQGSIWHGDALEFLKSLKPGSADLVFLDPPFNLGKIYSSQLPSLDKKDELEYKNWMEEILYECIRVLAPGAALYLYHLPSRAIHFGHYLEKYLQFQHWIAVSMKNGFVRGDRLYPAHYALLYFTNGEKKRFARPRVPPKTCRHCGGLIKDYGGYTRIIERKGINLSDVWEDLSPVRHNNKKHRIGNELPPALMERVIKISGARGAIYVDPFAGTGTGVLAAAMAGLKFAACDLVKENATIIVERLRSWHAQKRRKHR
jgi:site-specific DNA-methyltransferase (adenine-specific)